MAFIICLITAALLILSLTLNHLSTLFIVRQTVQPEQPKSDMYRRIEAMPAYELAKLIDVAEGKS